MTPSCPLFPCCGINPSCLLCPSSKRFSCSLLCPFCGINPWCLLCPLSGWFFCFLLCPFRWLNSCKLLFPFSLAFHTLACVHLASSWVQSVPYTWRVHINLLILESLDLKLLPSDSNARFEGIHTFIWLAVSIFNWRYSLALKIGIFQDGVNVSCR